MRHARIPGHHQARCPFLRSARPCRGRAGGREGCPAGGLFGGGEPARHFPERQRRHPYRRGQAGRGRGPQRHPRFREAVHGNAGRNHGTGRLHDRRVRAYPARFSRSVGLRLRVADCGEQCRGREQPGACPPYCYGRGSDGWLEDGYPDERFRGDGRFRLPDEQGSGLGRAGFLPAGRDGQGCGAPQRPF